MSKLQKNLSPIDLNNEQTFSKLSINIQSSIFEESKTNFKDDKTNRAEESLFTIGNTQEISSTTNILGNDEKQKRAWSYMAFSVFNILTFFPLAIYAIYLSADIIKKNRNGNYKLAAVSSRNVLVLNLVTVIVGVLFYVYILVNCCFAFFRDGKWPVLTL
jgi:hypothetical protein